MLGAGLLPGDYVVVQRGVKPALGNLIVVIVDQDYRIREWTKDNNGYYLKSATKKYKDIRPNRSLEVYGL